MTTRSEWAQQCAQLADDLRGLAARIEALPRDEDPFVAEPLQQGEWLREELQELSHDSVHLDPLVVGGGQ